MAAVEAGAAAPRARIAHHLEHWILCINFFLDFVPSAPRTPLHAFSIAQSEPRALPLVLYTQLAQNTPFGAADSTWWPEASVQSLFERKLSIANGSWLHQFHSCLSVSNADFDAHFIGLGK